MLEALPTFGVLVAVLTVQQQVVSQMGAVTFGSGQARVASPDVPVLAV